MKKIMSILILIGMAFAASKGQAIISASGYGDLQPELPVATVV